jgi:hypothetical protein
VGHIEEGWRKIGLPPASSKLIYYKFANEMFVLEVMIDCAGSGSRVETCSTKQKLPHKHL